MVCLLLAGSEVAVEAVACGTDPSALWTVEALDCRRLRGGMFFASPPFLLGSFPPVLLELSCSLVDEVAPIVSVKNVLLSCGVFGSRPEIAEAVERK